MFEKNKTIIKILSLFFFFNIPLKSFSNDLNKIDEKVLFVENLIFRAITWSIIGFYGYSLFKAIETSKVLNNENKTPIKRLTKSDWVGDFPSEIDQCIDMQNNEELYKSLNLENISNIILSGPPGNGKTMIARIIAGELGVDFFESSASSFVTEYQGSGAQNIIRLFSQARESALKSEHKKPIKAVVFIDEIDSIGGSRSLSANNKDIHAALNQLLSELTDPKNRNILIVAATNFIDSIDPALIRSGRLGTNIKIDNPNFNSRIDLMIHYLQKRRMPKNKIEEILDLIKLIAENSQGFSCADIEQIVLNSAFISVKNRSKYISIEDLKIGFESVWNSKSNNKRLVAWYGYYEKLKIVLLYLMIK